MEYDDIMVEEARKKALQTENTLAQCLIKLIEFGVFDFGGWDE